MKPYICKKMDWDWNVIDIILFVDDVEYNIKGFDEDEWQEAENFAESFAKSLNIVYVGDKTDS